MKNKKGFTLIELLAIIAILAIIVVITVPIISNAIDESRKKTAKASAYGYVDSIDNFYYTNRMSDPNFKMEGNNYHINANGYLVSKDETTMHQITFKGKIPSQGLISINRDGDVNGCIVINDYRFYIVDSMISDDILKGDDCKESFTITFETNGGNSIEPMTEKEGKTINLPTPTKNIDGIDFDFIGWYDSNGEQVSNTMPSQDVTYYAHYRNLVAKFNTNIVSKIKTTANNNLSNIYKFLRADSIDASYKTDTYKVSYDEESDVPIYMWFDSSTNTVYWYSLSEKPEFRTNTSLGSLFRDAQNLTDISGIFDWNVSNVTNMSKMFFNVRNLSSISGLANWNTSNVTNMLCMFYGVTNLSDISVLANWNTSNVTDMSGMFYGVTNLSDISVLANWNTDKVINMQSMFEGASNLSDISALANWNTGKVTNMSYMFRNTNLSNVNALANWNTGKVTNMSYMFCGATSLSDISGLANWNTGKVINMQSMFHGATSLSDISGLENWNTSNVTNMVCMFSETVLSNLNALANWNTGNVTDMSSMFFNMPNLSNVNALANWNTGKVTNMRSMFSYTPQLTDASLLHWVTKSVSSNNYFGMFFQSNISNNSNYPTFYSDDEKTQVKNGTWNSSGGTFTPSS